MDNISDLDKCAQLFRGIITTLDVKEMGYISFLLIGYDTTLKDFFESDPSARRHIDSNKLGVMPINEAEEVLIKGFKEAEITWNSEDLKKILLLPEATPIQCN